MKHCNNLGKYASKYFKTTIEILKNANDISTLKFFCFENNITVCGIKFIKEIIKKEIDISILKEMEIFSLNDGDVVNEREPVLIINGKYQHFALLEGIIDGILTRLSSISTNVKKIMEIDENINFIYMADRNDLYLNQPYDGYAAYIGGARNFVTEAMMKFIDSEDIMHVGTMPHSLIQLSKGDIINALKKFSKTYPENKVTALIDYSNDCLNEIKKIASSDFVNIVNFVRVDTSINLVDKCLQIGDWQNDLSIKGACSKLIFKVRKTLDECNLQNVKIIVTGSISKNKIIQYKKENTPIDVYGIGSWLLRKICHFTGDLIQINGISEAKIGRTCDIKQYLMKMNKWIL